MTIWHEITNTITGTHIKQAGPLPKLSVKLKRRGGSNKKFVTQVFGLEDFGIDPKDLVGELSRQGAMSAAVSEAPKKGHFKLLLQGDACDFLARVMQEKYGISQNLFVIEKPPPIVKKKPKKR